MSLGSKVVQIGTVEKKGVKGAERRHL